MSALCQAQPPILPLNDAIDAGLKNNRQLQIGGLEIARASEATAEARTARFPQLFDAMAREGILLLGVGLAR